MSKKRTVAETTKEVKADTKEDSKSEVKQEVKAEVPSAKKAMFARYRGPAPTPLRKIRGGAAGKGNSNLSKIQGVVTRVSDKTVNQASGPVVKKVVDVIVTNLIGNGSGDVVKTGVPGMDWIFPSAKVDSPEKSESTDGKFKAVAREINMDETQIRKLNVFSSHFYKEQKNGDAAAGVASVDVGSLVEINGVSIDAVTKGGSTNFYRNAGKLTPLTDKPPSARELGPHMIALMQEPGMQAWAAFQSSANAGGWFDTSGLNPEQVKQAEACQAMWSKVVESTANRLAVMSQGKDDIEETYFKNHEERVRATNPAKLAAGDVHLFLPGPYDKDLLPVLQIGQSPSERTPGMVQKLAGSIEDQASLPDAFAVQSVAIIDIRGKAVRLEMISGAIFDRAAAIAATDKDEHNPILERPNQRVPFTVSLRDIGWSFGSVIESKASMAASELLWSADFAAFPIMDRRVVDGAAEYCFPEGGKLFLDVPATLRKSALKVSEKFIKDVLCGGLAAYIPVKQKAEDVTKLEMPTGVTDLPYLVENGYEELSSGAGFNLENWEEEGTVEFYVVIEDVFKLLSENPEFSTSTDKAEAHLRKMEGLDTNVKLRNYLASQALVYAVKA